MYTSLESNKWKTPLLECHCESCFISYIAPCHVYAKLRNGNYAYHCCMYASLWVCMQLVYSWMWFIQDNVCPSNKVDYCFGLSENNCSQSYTLINDVPSLCTFYPEANICVYSSQQCITYHTYNHAQPMLFMFSLITYLSLCLLHVKLRNQIKEQNKIQEDPLACCATMCCSTCGLAQIYREV
jgi:hypothetical protein